MIVRESADAGKWVGGVAFGNFVFLCLNLSFSLTTVTFLVLFLCIKNSLYKRFR